MIEFNNIEEVRKYCESNGFKEYNPTEFSKAQYCFQKCYKDDIGKKYFIDINVYDFSFTSRISQNFLLEFEGQYYQAGTHDALNITFLSWELDQCEKFIDDLFDKGVLEHYETWEQS